MKNNKPLIELCVNYLYVCAFVFVTVLCCMNCVDSCTGSGSCNGYTQFCFDVDTDCTVDANPFSGSAELFCGSESSCYCDQCSKYENFDDTPIADPTKAPTPSPTKRPTRTPTYRPTATPTRAPTMLHIPVTVTQLTLDASGQFFNVQFSEKTYISGNYQSQTHATLCQNIFANQMDILNGTLCYMDTPNAAMKVLLTKNTLININDNITIPLDGGIFKPPSPNATHDWYMGNATTLPLIAPNGLNDPVLILSAQTAS